MRRNDKSWLETDEELEPFFPPEQAEAGLAELADLRNRLVKLEQQVLSQYAAMAAYATIAKNDSENVRAEARADLDRSQATVIGLTEKLRNELRARLDGIESKTSGDVIDVDGSRLARVEAQLANTMTALQQCLHENQELRTQIALLVEQRMQEQGWLVSSGTSDALSLH
jgi:hypothetical protein